MTNTIIAWLSQYQTALTWLGLISLMMFIFSLLMLPWLIRRIPSDYFTRTHEKCTLIALLSPVNILRNLLGFIILLAGLVMFALPGQGILTVIVGLAIMKFPGKYQLEHWLISRKNILSAVNWLRRKTGSTELKISRSPQGSGTMKQ